MSKHVLAGEIDRVERVSIRLFNSLCLPLRSSFVESIMSTPDIGRLDLSDSDNEDLFASPSKPSKTTQKLPTKQAENNAPTQRNGESKYDAEQAREVALQRELEGVRSINEVIEGVVSSLETAKGNMDVSCHCNLLYRSSLLTTNYRRYRGQSHLHLRY